ncbi:uncharacterized protein LOC121635192 [Melanotaenia boesemani]|uniref:uncharacterized protein LOC121635192 n=1 Tax=Melanotaenia boesemani TaxID=1250792 RepID=UPI001C045ED3|nr:uncharacterized protein LOC121635192 [Melanotaenia boesemani]
MELVSNQISSCLYPPCVCGHYRSCLSPPPNPPHQPGKPGEDWGRRGQSSHSGGISGLYGFCHTGRASCIFILLCVLEVVYVLWCKPSQEDGAEALQSEPEVEESQSFPVQLLALWNSRAGFLGKTILPVLQLIRLIIVGAAVKPVWDNELKHFVCESMQPGCSQAAFNTIFPFSLYQYWTLQVLRNTTQATKDRAEVEVKGHAGLLRAYVGILSAVTLLEVSFSSKTNMNTL